ncbi:MAG: helix-turn-helix transcriptional regulator [Clostridia bacterium]|nr:helix-turn-helix transcriptional regulator [Clostridia bacterium]
MNTDFAERLLKALENKGITRTELSQRSGVAKGDITHYLKGDYLPKQDKCYMLAKALDVDPGWLMTGVEQIGVPKREFTVFVPSPKFVKMTTYMTQEDYENVVKAFERAYEKMKELGVPLDD